MEPCKGGALADRLPEEAKDILNALHGGSPASYAIRFAASQPQVFMVLSGMSTLEQMQDNISFMKDFKPLSEEEKKTLQKVTAVFHAHGMIPCTACHYCTGGCPMKIKIPDLFSAMNTNLIYGNMTSAKQHYEWNTADGHGKASDCIQCGQCEMQCPQHIEIRKWLQEIAKTFE